MVHVGAPDVATGLASQAPRVDTLAFLAILEWRFLLPIGFGDTIRVVSRIEDKQPHARGRRGVVTWHRRILNQSGRVVQEGRTRSLVRGSARLAPPQPDPIVRDAPDGSSRPSPPPDPGPLDDTAGTTT